MSRLRSNVFQETFRRLNVSDARAYENEFGPRGKIVHIESADLPVPVAVMSSDIHTPTTRAEADELLRQLTQLPIGGLAKIYSFLHDGLSLRVEAARRDGEKWYKELK